MASQQKRKRGSESNTPIDPETPGGSPAVEESMLAIASPLHDPTKDPIEYWIKHGSWPKEYFQQDEQAMENLNRDPGSSVVSGRYVLPQRSIGSGNVLAWKKSRYTSSVSDAATPSDR